MKKAWCLQSFLLGALLLGGCAHGYRVYDAYDGNYHQWDRHEDVYYHQWAHENHHDRQDYKHLKPDDQKRYWEWRHNHNDH